MHKFLKTIGAVFALIGIEYAHVIQPEDQKKVNQYLIEKEKHSLAVFIASLVLSQTAALFTHVPKRA